MDRLDYNKFPAFTKSQIIQNCIESIEFDCELLAQCQDPDVKENNTRNNSFIDPLYSHLLSGEFPTAADFASLHRPKSTIEEPTTSALPKPVFSEAQIPAPKKLGPTPTKPVTIRNFFKSQSTKCDSSRLPLETASRVPIVPTTSPIISQHVKSPSPDLSWTVCDTSTQIPTRKEPAILTIESPKKTRGRQPPPGEPTTFTSAKDAYINEIKKDCATNADYKAAVRHLGLAKPTNNARFVPPFASNDPPPDQKQKVSFDPVDDRLKAIDEKLLERIKNDVIESPSSMSWDDIKGLEFAKTVIQETIIFPIIRPDLFTGLRRPPKGVLLFGPPGNGKTLIAKCIASTATAMFFNISASSLTSKWIGEGEMLVRALFTYAKINQPAVVFIDEVDSLLSRRSENEHESSRRLKTEFLVFLDGAGTGDDERILIIGATNRPQELDEAVRRRFTKRLYIPLPNQEARRDIIVHHLKSIEHVLCDDDVVKLARDTDGFSGADIKSLAQEASMIPMREMMKMGDFKKLSTLQKDEIPLVGYEHFKLALTQTRPSVSEDDIKEYVEWNKKYGSG